MRRLTHELTFGHQGGEGREGMRVRDEWESRVACSAGRRAAGRAARVWEAREKGSKGEGRLARGRGQGRKG